MSADQSASYIIFQDMWLSGGGGCDRYTSGNASIRTWAGSNITMRRLYIDSGRAVGIKTNSSYSVIEYSEVHNEVEDMGSTGTIFRHNVVSGVGGGGSTFNVKGGSQNFQAYNNVVHITHATSGGLILGGSTGSGLSGELYECYHCVAYNNVVINETGNVNQMTLAFRSCKNCIFLNNVSIGGTLGIFAGGPSSNGTTTGSSFLEQHRGLWERGLGHQLPELYDPDRGLQQLLSMHGGGCAGTGSRD